MIFYEYTNRIDTRAVRIAKNTNINYLQIYNSKNVIQSEK